MSSRLLLFSDDTPFQELGFNFITKKTFRVVSDATAPVVKWHIVISLFNAGPPGTVSARVQIGTNTSLTIQTNAVTEKVFNATFNKTSSNNNLLTVNFQIKSDGGGAIAQLQYTDLYSII